MSRAFGKGGRSSGAARGFGSPAPAGFGGFSSAGGSGLSYLSEPPNLTSISDANVVVAFKNALKKDATTKAKALEDLLAYVQAHPFEVEGGVEESILEAWVRYSQNLVKLGDHVLICVGSNIPSHLDRQLPPRPRTLPHPTVRVDEVGTEAHGKACP